MRLLTRICFVAAALSTQLVFAQGRAGALGGLGEAMTRRADQMEAEEQQQRAFQNQKRLIELQFRMEEERQRAFETRRLQQEDRARQAAVVQRESQAESERHQQAERARALANREAEDKGTAQERERQLALLSTIHPDWPRMRKSPAFLRWAERTLSRDEQEKFAGSWDAAYVASIFSRYKKARGL